jgi:hypothetical protein
VNAEAEDDALAQTVGEFLARNGVASVFPMRGGQPSEVRKDLENNLLYCDGVIVVYGSIPLLWVRQQLVYCLKQAFRRDQPLKVFAVYEGPPEPKSPLSVTIPNLHIVHSSHGLNERDLQTLLAASRMRCYEHPRSLLGNVPYLVCAPSAPMKPAFSWTRGPG